MAANFEVDFTFIYGLVFGIEHIDAREFDEECEYGVFISLGILRIAILKYKDNNELQ